MECSDSNINNINISIKDSSPKKNNINDIIFPIIKNKNFIDNFDSFIFGYLLGDLLKNKIELIDSKLIEEIYAEYQKQNKLPFDIIYKNIDYYISSLDKLNNKINNININLNPKKEDSDNFTLFGNEENPKGNNNIIDINSIDDNCINYYNDKNKNKIEEKEVKKPLIGPEDYEDYIEEEEEDQ